MTVGARVSTAGYTEDGSTASFPVPFRYKAAQHLTATRTFPSGAVVALAYGTDFTATDGGTDDGGTLTVTAPAAAGTRLTIRRTTPRAQDAQYPTNDRFPAKLTETALDTGVLISQEIDDEIGDIAARALLLPDSAAAADALVGTFPVVLPGRRLGYSTGTGADAGLRGDLASLLGTLFVGGPDGAALENRLRLLQPRAPAIGFSALRAGLTRATAGVLATFWDPDVADHRIRPTSGSGGAKFGTIDYTAPHPSFWQQACLVNAFANEQQHNLIGQGAAMSGRISNNFDYLQSRVGGDLTLRQLAGDDITGATIYTSDDGWLMAQTWMQTHMATTNVRALGLMIEAIVNTCYNFTDPRTAVNPTITYAAQSPNLLNIDYGLGAYVDPIDGATKFKGRPFRASTYGSLYDHPSHPEIATRGYISAAIEAQVAVCAVYAFEHLNLGYMLDFAKQRWQWIHDYLLSAEPTANPYPRADGVGPQPPGDPALRMAGGLVFAEQNLQPTDPAPQETDAPFLAPLRGYYGRPIRNSDATYLAAHTGWCVLGARLYALTGDDNYRAATVRSANAIISPQAWGRTVAGKTLIANTRDPHADGFWICQFAAEVLPLAGIAPALKQAFVDTGAYVAANCVFPDGCISADWGGPELAQSGTTTWQQDYDANPGGEAGRQQIMVTAGSLAMIQAGALVARWGEDFVTGAAGGVVPAPAGTDTVLDRLARSLPHAMTGSPVGMSVPTFAGMENGLVIGTPPIRFPNILGQLTQPSPAFDMLVLQRAGADTSRDALRLINQDNSAELLALGLDGRFRGMGFDALPGGDNLTFYGNPLPRGVGMHLAYGSAAAPVTSAAPRIKISHTERIADLASMAGNPVDNTVNGALVVIARAATGSKAQPNAGGFYATGNPDIDLCGLVAGSQRTGTAADGGRHNAYGFYAFANSFGLLENAVGGEIQSGNYSSADKAVNIAGQSEGMGWWMTANGPRHSAVGIGLGSANGTAKWQLGFQVTRDSVIPGGFGWMGYGASAPAGAWNGYGLSGLHSYGLNFAAAAFTGNAVVLPAVYDPTGGIRFGDIDALLYADRAGALRLPAKVGFGRASVDPPTLPAAAADLATTTALVNAIRAALTNNGLAK